jgi:hypothetical protein
MRAESALGIVADGDVDSSQWSGLVMGDARIAADLY